MDAPQKTICDLCAHTPICKNQPQQSCPYLQLKEKKPSPIEPKIQAKPKKSVLRKLWIGFLWCVVLICIALAFVVGRFSMYPRVVSLMPDVSRNIKPELSPEQVVKEFFKAAQSQDAQRVLALCHPDLKADNYHLLDLMEEAPDALDTVREINIMNLEELAKLSIVLTGDDRNIDSGAILLKKHQGEWRVFDLSGL